MLHSKFIHANGKDVLCVIPTSPLFVSEGGKALEVIELPVWQIKDPSIMQAFSHEQIQLVGSITVFDESTKLKDRFGKSFKIKNEALALYDTVIGEYKSHGSSQNLLNLIQVFWACFPEYRTLFPLEFKYT